jgi:hypothetical protein
VRVVSDARLMEDLDLAAQLAVTGLDEGGVLGHGHHLIGVADDMKEGDPRLGEGYEGVHRVVAISQGLGFVLETVVLEQLRPVVRTALALAFAAGPALEIAYRGIAVDYRDLVGILRRPAIGIEAAPTEPDEHRFPGQPTPAQHLVESTELFHARGAAKGVAHHDMCVVEAFRQ